MRIYFAGNITEMREREYSNILAQRLFSYFYHGDQKEFNKEFIFKIKQYENLSRDMDARNISR